MNAVVLDISVPSNLDPSIHSTRPDVRVYLGGLATLPPGQRLATHTMPIPVGESYACLAETITLGLHRKLEPFSFGPLKKQQVLEIAESAREVGIGLGSLVPFRPRPRD
jgi:predicted amino acid dehydrogenase